MPYIVKWESGDTISNPTFNGVTIKNEQALVITTDVDFKGTFSPATLAAADHDKLYLGADNTLYYPASNVTLNACRAYFELNGLTVGNGTNAIKAFNLRFGEGSEESTGINEMSNGKCQMANESDSWYTLSGVRLQGKPAKRGVYIRAGRKVVVQ